MAKDRPRVLVVYPFANPDAFGRLAARAEVVNFDPEAGTTFSEALADVDGVILRPPAVVDASVLAGVSRLRVIGNIGTGLDHIDLEATRARGVEVVSGSGGNANAVAEYAIAMALNLAHRLCLARDSFASGELLWAKRIAALRGRELRGRVLGVLGLGSIGRRVAELGSGTIGMRVAGFDPNVTGIAGVEAADSVEELCNVSDVLCVHVPLLAETRGMVGAGELERLGPEGILVNASRGGIVDEHALVAALRAGTLWGAALDVFEEEPPSGERLRELANVPGLVLTPHIAGVTSEAGAALADAAVDGVLAVLAADEAR